MKYYYPLPWGGYFEIYNSWIDFSEIKKFKRKIEYFIPSINEGFEIIKLSDIKPPTRSKGITPFSKCRTVSLLCAITNTKRLPPVIITKSKKYYILKDGFHRYHVSIIAGFSCIPAIINKKLQQCAQPDS